MLQVARQVAQQVVQQVAQQVAQVLQVARVRLTPERLCLETLEVSFLLHLNEKDRDYPRLLYKDIIFKDDNMLCTPRCPQGLLNSL